MEFDARLHQTFDALAERLHQEIAAQLTAARVDLSASVQSDRETAIAEAAREARTAAEQEVSDRFTDAVGRAGTDARAAAASRRAATDRLVDAVRAIDSAHSLSEVMDVLLAAASLEADRAAIFLPQGSTLKAWRQVGFDTLTTDGSEFELPFADGGMIAEAGDTGHSIRLDPGASRATLLPAFVDLPDQGCALAVPLVMTGQSFAVLYVDEGRPDAAVRESWPAAIEVLARHAARSLEAITATRLAQVTEVMSR